MTRAVALLALVALLASPLPVAARGDFDEGDDSPIEAPEADAGGDGGAGEPAPASDDAASPPSAPDDLYLVTDVYAGDVVTRDGDVTRYATDTRHETPGTYARVLDTVGTGQSSAYDGASFNGRATTSDARPVAGTYYETFVQADRGFVSVGVVFFQDDSETAKHPAPAQPELPAFDVRPVIAPPDAEPPPSTIEPPSPHERPEPPGTEGRPEPLDASLARVDVLRGRRVRLWLTATSGGAPVRVGDWSFVDGECEVEAKSGHGDEPVALRFDRLAPPGSAWTVRFRVNVRDAASVRSAEARFQVVVRAPALVE